MAEAGPFLNLAVVDAISVKALGLTEAKFKKYVANPIKKYVGVPLSEISLEGLILLVRLQAKFGVSIVFMKIILSLEGVEGHFSFFFCQSDRH